VHTKGTLKKRTGAAYGLPNSSDHCQLVPANNSLKGTHDTKNPPHSHHCFGLQELLEVVDYRLPFVLLVS